MAAAEAGAELHDARSLRADAELGRGWPVLDPERLGRLLGHGRRRLAPVAWPDVRQRQPVHHRQWLEDAAAGEPRHRHLRALRELLDEAEPAPRGAQGLPHRVLQLVTRAHEREAATALAVGGLDDAREPELVVRLGHDLPACLRDPGLRPDAPAGVASSWRAPRLPARSGAATRSARRCARRRRRPSRCPARSPRRRAPLRPAARARARRRARRWPADRRSESPAPRGRDLPRSRRGLARAPQPAGRVAPGPPLGREVAPRPIVTTACDGAVQWPGDHDPRGADRRAEERPSAWR